MAINPPTPSQKDKSDETELRKALAEITTKINEALAAPKTVQHAEYYKLSVADNSYADNTWVKGQNNVTDGFTGNYLVIKEDGIYFASAMSVVPTAGAHSGAEILVNDTTIVGYSFGVNPAGYFGANSATSMALKKGDKVSFLFYTDGTSPGRLSLTKF